jgi:hypothetical protein
MGGQLDLGHADHIVVLRVHGLTVGRGDPGVHCLVGRLSERARFLGVVPDRQLFLCDLPESFSELLAVDLTVRVKAE